ncbi:hypothetical protein [Alkalihalobacillus sp. AL-G]|uniref:hypothetical protein n=1 Tax=Alkalihalobacillus sp. AL-G TaxID=2926399 RepID=UPI002729854E|nr:hypothetical protein [Alkalihalobacillus sp. AL-G]WLD93903.1 hypothetical protein MOJ78_03005 [Alkalihalobacillus sp. AL-G]
MGKTKQFLKNMFRRREEFYLSGLITYSIGLIIVLYITTNPIDDYFALFLILLFVMTVLHFLEKLLKYLLKGNNRELRYSLFLKTTIIIFLLKITIDAFIIFS